MATAPYVHPQPWLPSGAARELVWWDATTLAALAGDFAQAVRDWGSAWGVETFSLHTAVEPVAAFHAVNPGSSTVCRDGIAVGWLHGDDEARDALLRTLFAELGCAGELARRVTAECQSDVLRRLALVLGAQVRPAPPGPGAHREPLTASGALKVSFHGVAVPALLLAGAGTQTWRSRRVRGCGHGAVAERSEQLCSTSTAISGRALAMHASLAGCEVDVGTLQTLQIGDVLRLRHPLAEPAVVTDSQGTRLFSGHLAQRCGSLALELAPLGH